MLLLTPLIALAMLQDDGPRPVGTISCKQNTTIPMTMEDAHLYIPVSMNGGPSTKMLLDTGCGGGGTISKDVAKKMHLKVIGESISSDPSGKNPQHNKLYLLPKLKFGGVTVTDVVLSEAPSRSMRVTDSAGVLGIECYSTLLAKIDYPKMKFTLTPQGWPTELASATASPAKKGFGIYSIRADVSGQDVVTHIDTGSSGMILLPERVAKKLTLVGEPKLRGQARTPFNTFNIYSCRVKGTIRFAGVTLTDPEIEYADIFPVMNVGSKFLKDYVVYFDQRSKQMALVHG